MQVIKGFANLLPPKCTVCRDGVERQMDAEKLVVGDMVWIRNGEKVHSGIQFCLFNNHDGLIVLLSQSII